MDPIDIITGITAMSIMVLIIIVIVMDIAEETVSMAMTVTCIAEDNVGKIDLFSEYPNSPRWQNAGQQQSRSLCKVKTGKHPAISH